MSAALSNSVRLKRRHAKKSRAATPRINMELLPTTPEYFQPALPPTPNSHTAPSPLQQRRPTTRNLVTTESSDLSFPELIFLLRAKLTARSGSDESIVRKHIKAVRSFAPIAEDLSVRNTQSECGSSALRKYWGWDEVQPANDDNQSLHQTVLVLFNINLTHSQTQQLHKYIEKFDKNYRGREGGFAPINQSLFRALQPGLRKAALQNRQTAQTSVEEQAHNFAGAPDRRQSFLQLRRPDLSAAQLHNMLKHKLQSRVHTHGGNLLKHQIHLFRQFDYDHDGSIGKHEVIRAVGSKLICGLVTLMKHFSFGRFVICCL